MPTSTQKGRNMEIEIKSTQILENSKETILQKGNGQIKELAKGTVLTWTTIEEKQTYQMTILENNINCSYTRGSVIANNALKIKTTATTTMVTENPWRIPLSSNFKIRGCKA